jgi:hypothetical protein
MIQNPTEAHEGNEGIRRQVSKKAADGGSPFGDVGMRQRELTRFAHNVSSFLFVSFCSTCRGRPIQIGVTAE